MADTVITPVTHIADPVADGHDTAVSVLRHVYADFTARTRHMEKKGLDRIEPDSVFPPVELTVHHLDSLIRQDQVAKDMLSCLFRHGRHAAISVVVFMNEEPLSLPAQTAAEAIAVLPEIAVELVNIAIEAVDPGPEKVKAGLDDEVIVDWGIDSVAGSAQVSASRRNKMREVTSEVRTRLRAAGMLVKMPDSIILEAEDGIVVRLNEPGGPAGKILARAGERQPVPVPDVAAAGDPDGWSYPLSYTADGRPGARFDLQTQDGTTSSVIVGPAGSGKSEWILLHMTECMATRMTTVWYGNPRPVPGGPEPAARADWPASNASDVMTMLRAAVAVTDARRKKLKRQGARTWQVAAKTPMLRVIVANADLLMADPVRRDEAARLIQFLRGLGRLTGVGLDLVASVPSAAFGHQDDFIRLHRAGLATMPGVDVPVQFARVTNLEGLEPAFDAQVALDGLSAWAARRVAGCVYPAPVTLRERFAGLIEEFR